MLWPCFIDGVQLNQGYRSTTRTQFKAIADIIYINVAYFLYKRGYFKVGGITAKMLKIIALGFSLCSLFE